MGNAALPLGRRGKLGVLILPRQVQDVLFWSWRVLKSKQFQAGLEEPVLKCWGELPQTKCLEEDLGGFRKISPLLRECGVTFTV